MRTDKRVIALLLMAMAACTDAEPSESPTGPPDTTSLIDDRDETSSDAANDDTANDGADAADGDVATKDASNDVLSDDSADDVIAPANAALRVLHLAGGAPAVDFHLDGLGPVVSGLAFGAGTAFQPVVGGTIAVDVVPSGKPLSSSVLQGEVAVPDGGSWSVAVLSAADGLSLLSYASDRDAPSPGRVRLRFIHAAAMGPVDVLDGASVVADDLAFAAAQGGVEFPEGARRYSLDTTSDGIAEKSCNLVAFPAGTIADVFVTGDAEATSLVVWFDNGATVEVVCTSVVEPPNDAELRVLHAAPSIGPVDVTLSSLQAPDVWSGLEFGVGSPYVTVPAVLADLKALGASLPGSSEPILEGSLGLEPGQSASVILIDTSATSLGDSAASVVLDDDRTPPPEGAVRVRVVHAMVGLPPITASLAGVPVATTLPVGKTAGAVAVSGDLVTTDAPLTLRIGWGEELSTELECALPAVPTGSILSLIVSRSPSGDDPLLLLWSDDGGGVTSVTCSQPLPPPKAELRLLHLAPNLGAVNASVGSDLLTSSLEFPDGTPYAAVVAGDVTVSLSLLGGGSALITTLSLSEGTSSSAIALATGAGFSVVALTDDRSPPAPGRARLRAFHGVATVPAVDLYAGGDPLFVDLTFGQASPAVEVEPGAFQLGIDTNDDGTAELLCSLSSLSPGDIATAFAAPSGDGVQIVLWFDDGATALAPCSPPLVDGAFVRALNLLSGVPPVNMTWGGSAIASALPSWAGSAYASVPSLADSARVATLAGTVLASTSPQPLLKGASYTVVALGPSASPVAALFTDNLNPVPAAQVRVRFVHAVPGAGAIDVYATPNPATKIKVTSGLSFGKAGSWLQGANSPVTSGIDVGADGTIDWSCPKVLVESESVTSVYFVLQASVLTMIHHGDSGPIAINACAAATP